MKTLVKIIGTTVVATAGNFVTGCIASKDMRGPVSNNDLPLKIIVGTGAGFLLSTAPAIVMTAATNIASLSGGQSTVVGAIATWFGYDYYLKIACPKKDLIKLGKGLCKSGQKILNAGLNEGKEAMNVQFEIERLKYETSSYIHKVHSSDEMKFAYKLNTIGQNFLFNYIWESSDESAPELENGTPEGIHS